MARVEKFDCVTRERNSVHQIVVAEVHSFSVDGSKYLQIDTLGKVGRKIPNKISQSFQIDVDAAKKLKSLLESTFKI